MQNKIIPFQQHMNFYEGILSSQEVKDGQKGKWQQREGDSNNHIGTNVSGKDSLRVAQSEEERGNW